MKKNLYIFRHGQTDFNLHNIWQGCQCNPDLNETGRRQAYELGQNCCRLTSKSSTLLRSNARCKRRKSLPDR